MKIITLCLSAMFILSSCQTSYRAKSMLDGLGYQDKRLKSGVYQILYKVNAATPEDIAIDLWHMRATELCGHSNYFSTAKVRSHQGSAKRVKISNNHYYRSPSEYTSYSEKNHTFSYASDRSINQVNYAVPRTSYKQRNIRNYTKWPSARGLAYCEGKPKYTASTNN
jgi:hypothetical protein